LKKKKKTYVFNQHTLEILDALKDMTKKSETQIIAEALELLEGYIRKEKELDNSLDILLEKISELSYKLGKCEEKLEQLKNKKQES
jgi:translation initiation factor 2B subunit (eIF-2B alpha/beta/delta family)